VILSSSTDLFVHPVLVLYQDGCEIREMIL